MYSFDGYHLCHGGEQFLYKKYFWSKPQKVYAIDEADRYGMVEIIFVDKIEDGSYFPDYDSKIKVKFSKLESYDFTKFDTFYN